MSHIPVKFPRPFLVAEEVRERLIKPSEAEVSPVQERYCSREGDLHGRLLSARIDEVRVQCLNGTQVEEESIVAYAQTGPDRRVPNIACSFLAFRTISFHLVAVARKQIGIIGVKRLPCFSRRHSGNGDVNIASRAFAVVIRATLSVIHDDALL